MLPLNPVVVVNALAQEGITPENHDMVVPGGVITPDVVEGARRRGERHPRRERGDAADGDEQQGDRGVPGRHEGRRQEPRRPQRRLRHRHGVVEREEARRRAARGRARGDQVARLEERRRRGGEPSRSTGPRWRPTTSARTPSPKSPISPASASSPAPVAVLQIEDGKYKVLSNGFIDILKPPDLSAGRRLTGSDWFLRERGNSPDGAASQPDHARRFGCGARQSVLRTSRVARPGGRGDRLLSGGRLGLRAVGARSSRTTRACRSPLPSRSEEPRSRKTCVHQMRSTRSLPSRRLPARASRSRRRKRPTAGTPVISPTPTATSGKSPTIPASPSSPTVRSRFRTSARHRRVAQRDACEVPGVDGRTAVTWPMPRPWQRSDRDGRGM